MVAAYKVFFGARDRARSAFRAFRTGLDLQALAKRKVPPSLREEKFLARFVPVSLK